MTAEDRMALARAAAIHKAPYFSSAILNFSYKAIPGFPSMFVTSEMVLGYGVEWASSASIDELAADIAHETHHFLRNHLLFFSTFPSKDLELLNIAGDLAINPDLRNEGWKLAKSAIFPEHFKLPEGKTIMEYFDLLQKDQSKKNKSSDGKEPNKEEKEENNGNQNTPDKTKPERGVGSGRCGSIAGEVVDASLEKALNEEQGRSELEKQVILKQVQRDIKAHVEAKGRGTLPNDLVTWATVEEKPPKVNWREELAQHLQNCTGQIQSGGDDFSLSRPSKRSYVRGILRPGLIEHTPVVAFVLDSSGSMGTKQLKSALEQAAQVLEQLDIDEMWFCEADAAVSLDFQLITPRFLHDVEIKGRGGTDFRPAIEAARNLVPKPDLLIYGTDGDGTAPKEQPFDMEVVWLIVPGHYNKAPTSWGIAVFIKD